VLVELHELVVLLKTILDQILSDHPHKIKVQEAIGAQIQHLLNAIPNIIYAYPSVMLAER
jgi:hypothetical protein